MRRRPSSKRKYKAVGGTRLPSLARPQDPSLAALDHSNLEGRPPSPISLLGDSNAPKRQGEGFLTFACAQHRTHAARKRDQDRSKKPCVLSRSAPRSGLSRELSKWLRLVAHPHWLRRCGRTCQKIGHGHSARHVGLPGFRPDLINLDRPVGRYALKISVLRDLNIESEYTVH